MSENQAQIDYWNGQAGSTWARVQTRMDAMLQPLSDKAIERANVQPGHRVIDVGCGCGATSLALQDLGAQVWGVDVSEPMLALARERAKGREHIAFSVADAAEQTYTPDHDLVFSRFGVMFFADPTKAFANLRTSLNASGRLSFVCWQAPRQNPWMSLVGAAIQPLLPEPETPIDPRAPGPFAFAEPQYLQNILAGAGFENIEIEDYRTQLHVADELESAIESLSEVGPLARALAELSGEKLDQALNVARDTLAQHMTPAGLDLEAAVWLVSADGARGLSKMSRKE